MQRRVLLRRNAKPATASDMTDPVATLRIGGEAETRRVHGPELTAVITSAALPAKANAKRAVAVSKGLNRGD
jgi:hypothetical protein